MNSPRRRALWLYLSLNLVFALAIAMPATALTSHFVRTWLELPRMAILWSVMVASHLVLTTFWIPRFSRWLTRKDAERAARSQAKKLNR